MGNFRSRSSTARRDSSKLDPPKPRNEGSKRLTLESGETYASEDSGSGLDTTRTPTTRRETSRSAPPKPREEGSAGTTLKSGETYTSENRGSVLDTTRTPTTRKETSRSAPPKPSEEGSAGTTLKSGETYTSEGIGSGLDTARTTTTRRETSRSGHPKPREEGSAGTTLKSGETYTSENRGSGLHTTSQSANKELFIKLLKATYQKQYDSVQPIPYIRDRLYCVDRVFVEGGIEYLAGSWVHIDSYHLVFRNSQIKSRRRIIIGEPGYGKSTLTLQWAYDWCNSIKESYLKDIDVLILLRLRQLAGVMSLSNAIRQFLLQRHPQFSDDGIESILGSSPSVVVILDGFDEYPDADKKPLSDVMKMIMTPVFHQFEVTLTTRYLPKYFAPETKRLRLTGFDDRARNEYIRKAVAGNDTHAIRKVKQKLQENAVLEDLAQVPLFFVLYAHLSNENEEFETFKTVTGFFKYMIKCFHSHMRNKMDDANVQRYHMYEKDHRKLDKLAFEGLSKENQQIVWRKRELCNILGKDFYDQYKRIGIFVEEEVIDESDGYGSPSIDQYQRQVSFYHKLFCEWYAAHYLAACAVHFRNSDKLRNLIKHMDPKDLHYCFRFACGLNREAVPYISGCIEKDDVLKFDNNKITALCILEQGIQFDDILDTVRDVCSYTIQISETDSRGVQRCLILFLQMASKYNISISRVWLYNCYSTVDLRGGNHLQLKSNLSIPVLTTLNKLWIDPEGEGREITSEEFTGILQYSSKCLALKELWFWDSLLPPSVQAESVSVLRSRNVKVTWFPTSTLYQLNLHSCRWEFKPDYGTGLELELSDEQYQTEVRKFRKRWKLNE